MTRNKSFKITDKKNEKIPNEKILNLFYSMPRKIESIT